MKNKQIENNQKEWAKELFEKMATIVKTHAHKGKREKEEKRKRENRKKYLKKTKKRLDKMERHSIYR